MRLRITEAEITYQATLGSVAAFATTNQCDDFIDNIDRFQQTNNDVQASFVARQPETRAPNDDILAMFYICLAHALERHRTRTTAIQGDHVNRKIVLKIGVFPQLIQNNVRVFTLLEFNDQANAVTDYAAINLEHAFDALIAIRIDNRFVDGRQFDAVRNLGDHQRIAAIDLLLMNLRAHDDATTASFIGVTDA